MPRTLPAPRPPFSRRLLTAKEFQQLKDVPPAAEWFADLDSPGTRRMYQQAIGEFMRFTGMVRPEEFRVITRSHVIAWRKELMGRRLAGATIRAKLAALSSLFEYLCDRNTITHNPVKGVARPKVESTEGKTPAISDAQVRALPGSDRGRLELPLPRAPQSNAARSPRRPTQGRPRYRLARSTAPWSALPAPEFAQAAPE